MCMKVLETLSVENLVRSGVVLAVGLPVALSLGSLTSSTAELVRQNSATGSGFLTTGDLRYMYPSGTFATKVRLAVAAAASGSGMGNVTVESSCGAAVSAAGFFIFESFRGGIDVAWRSLHPRMPLAPRFFEHEIHVPEGQPSTLLISTISLLPGTLSAELVRGEHVLVVHTLADGGEDSVARLEHRIARLFSVAVPRMKGGKP